MSYSSEVLADSPMGYWRLDDASGNFTDSSGNARAASVTGSPTYSQPPAKPAIGGTSCTFGASPYGTVGFASWMNSLTALSAEAWVKYTSAATIMMMGRDSSFRQLQFRANAGKFDLIVFDSGSSAVTLTSPLTYNDGAWHHVVGTYANAASGNNMFLYVDGAQVNVTAHSTNLGTSSATDSFFLAARSTAANVWDGSLDELAIYSTALSSARVAAHYAAATPAVTVTIPPIIMTNRAALMRAATR
jgi:hypothetical protein